jgi:hypothetical protein
MMATTAILTVLGVGIYLLTQEDSNALVKTNNIGNDAIIKDCIFDRTIFDGLLPFLTYSISSKSLCLDILHLNENIGDFDPY